MAIGIRPGFGLHQSLPLAGVEPLAAGAHLGGIAQGQIYQARFEARVSQPNPRVHVSGSEESDALKFQGRLAVIPSFGQGQGEVVVQPRFIHRPVPGEQAIPIAAKLGHAFFNLVAWFDYFRVASLQILVVLQVDKRGGAVRI